MLREITKNLVYVFLIKDVWQLFYVKLVDSFQNRMMIPELLYIRQQWPEPKWKPAISS